MISKAVMAHAEAEDKKLKAGSKPRRKNWDGRCLQLSTACVLGLPWRLAAKGWNPSVESDEDFRKMPDDEFWGRWRSELKELGYEDISFTPNGKNEPEGFWIAIVNGSEGTTHAVVMQGWNLHYDPSGNRTQRPHKFRQGYKLVPHGNH